MATRKAAKKTASRTSAKTAAKTKTARKTTGRAAAKKKAARSTATKATRGRKNPASGKTNGTGSTKRSAGKSTATASGGSIRVRMYRVGFGDFFLLTVPGKNGPAHILIDCGVHAANIGSINDCIQDMKKETGNHLALVILTHYHADHMSGFASNYDDFAEFDVGAVWITNRLDPSNPKHANLMAQLTSVAQQLKLQLGARTDETSIQAARKVENALGVASEDGGGGSNAKALRLLQSGFKNKPPVYYYQGGNDPTLPDELEGMITAEILGPSPIDSDGEFAASDNKTEQYLTALGETGIPDTGKLQPFDIKTWKAGAGDYPQITFDEFDTRIDGGDQASKRDGVSKLQSTLAAMQPDTLAATADKLDGTLNNQSLVVLFTCQGKKLLFVGDAQWGNWAYWLYGKAVTGSDPGITQRAKDILGSIDFYKVGHHGSTNATPIPAVGALNEHCASMCSTATGAYGNPDRKTEVPRTALMDAIETKTGKRLVRSDWVAAAGAEPDPEAREELADLPDGFTTPGELYIDYGL
jgi:beta-lactamase superfamily II metal-dependent hydrolase